MVLRSLSSVGRHATTDSAVTISPRYTESRGSSVTVSVKHLCWKKRFSCLGDLRDFASIFIGVPNTSFCSSTGPSSTYRNNEEGR
jgi:hypothetical protein